MRQTIQFEGLIAAEDFVRAQRLHQRSFRGRLVRLFAFVVVVVLGTGLALNELYFAASTVAAMFLLLLLAPWIDPWRWRRMYRRQPGLRERVEGEINDEGVRYEGDLAPGLLRWRIFNRARTDDGMILLYQAPNLFNLLPRGLFASDEDWRQARELVREKVRKSGAEAAPVGE